MKIQQFIEAVRKLANGEYFTTSIEYTEFSSRKPDSITITWKCYVHGYSGHCADSPEKSIAKLKAAMFPEKYSHNATDIGELDPLVKS